MLFVVNANNKKGALCHVTPLLYHAFNIKGVECRSTDFLGDSIIFSVEMMDKFVKCPCCCTCRTVVFKGQKTRQFKMGVFGRKQAYLKLLSHRLKCIECNNLWWPKLSFMDGKHSSIRSFALTVIDLLRFGTIKDVANYLNVGWDLVKNIHKSKLQRLYKRMPVHKIKYLGIEEFSLRKGHNYMTIFIDLKTGRIVNAGEGRSKDAVKPFLKKLAKKSL